MLAQEWTCLWTACWPTVIVAGLWPPRWIVASMIACAGEAVSAQLRHWDRGTEEAKHRARPASYAAHSLHSIVTNDEAGSVICRESLQAACMIVLLGDVKFHYLQPFCLVSFAVLMM